MSAFPGNDGNGSVRGSWLNERRPVARLDTWLSRRPKPDPLEDLLGSTPAPPALDMPAMEASGNLAAAKQRKRVAKYAMLIEGQPEAATIAAGPANAGTRKRLGGY